MCVCRVNICLVFECHSGKKMMLLLCLHMCFLHYVFALICIHSCDFYLLVCVGR